MLYVSDSNAYAHYVFNAFDKDKNGSISFEVSPTFHLLSELYIELQFISDPTRDPWPVY